ncbi:MAG: glutathione S-transferase family protein [Pseudomonadota bacterium]
MKILGDKRSGNCYKVQLVCALLGLSYEWVSIDILAGETTKEGFLSRNPAGKIPLLELDDGRFLSESNAIINYLAAASPLVPTGAFEAAKVQQWQFFEQYSHEPYIAVARFIAKYLGMPQDRLEEYKAKQAGGYRALTVVEEQLGLTSFLVGETITTADISLYAYTHVAHEGGFDLTDYPRIREWIRRIESTPGYVPLG